MGRLTALVIMPWRSFADFFLLPPLLMKVDADRDSGTRALTPGDIPTSESPLISG